MGAGTSLESLRAQKTSVKNGMISDKDDISSAEDEIELLQKASDSLKSSIEEVEGIKESIDELEVTKGKWKGEVENKFTSQQDAYQTGIGTYLNNTKTAKEDVDEALEKAKQKKASAVTRLENMEKLLGDLESDIAKVKED